MAKKEKISLEEVKKIPVFILMKMINKAKSHLKHDETMQKIFKEYDADVDYIDFIPTAFADLDVSAKTDHGVVYLNYELLCDGDFLEDYQYLIHEYTHWAQQCLSDKPTKGADDGNYLENPYEVEGFQNQLEYAARDLGKKEVHNYVDDLLEHHEVPKKKKEEKKEELLELVE
jgi:hypothetical protein